VTVTRSSGKPPFFSSAHSTVVDGEIVCVDKRGRPQFRDLLFHRGTPCFFAFDLPMSNGKDLRPERLIDRKQELRRILVGLPARRLRYADMSSVREFRLFHRICQLDLEGIVAKLSLGPYVAEKQPTTGFKVGNSNYSQWEGRENCSSRNGTANERQGGIHAISHVWRLRMQDKERKFGFPYARSAFLRNQRYVNNGKMDRELLSRRSGDGSRKDARAHSSGA
jgi:hypothetical protein